jgi:hypothetical protein
MASSAHVHYEPVVSWYVILGRNEKMALSLLSSNIYEKWSEKLRLMTK